MMDVVKLPRTLSIGEAKRRIRRNYPDIYLSICRTEVVKARKACRKREELNYKRLRKMDFEKTKMGMKAFDALITSFYKGKDKRHIEQLTEMWHLGFDAAWEICRAKHGKRRKP